MHVSVSGASNHTRIRKEAKEDAPKAREGRSGPRQELAPPPQYTITIEEEVVVIA